MGAPLATINALGNRVTTSFDAVGQTVALVDANGGRNTLLYDAAGHKTVLIRPTFAANDCRLGRRWPARPSVSMPAEIAPATFSTESTSLSAENTPTDRGSRWPMTATGNRVTMRDSTGRYTYRFDALNRKTMVALPSTQRLTYTFDALGQRNYLVAPTGGRFTYSLRRGATDHKGRRILRATALAFVYDNASRRTVKYLANGTRRQLQLRQRQ